MAFICYVYAMAIGFVVLPFTHVFLSLFIFPKAIPLHRSIFEISHVVLLIDAQQTMPLRFVIDEIPIICRMIGENHISFPHFMVKTELSFIKTMLAD